MNEKLKQRLKETKEEIKHIVNGGNPRCFHCKKDWKKVEEQSGKTWSTWEPDCKCVKKPIRMSIG